MKYHFHSTEIPPSQKISEEVYSVLCDLKDKPGPDRNDYKSLRQQSRFTDYEAKGPDLACIEDQVIFAGARQIPIRIYYPNFHDQSPLLFFIHGGSWTFCSIATHDNFCRTMAQKSQSVVVSLDYRLAPEHPFPAGLNDCVATLKWCRENAGLIGIHPDYITVCGDSAGANLATASCLYLKIDGSPVPKRQILLYPIVDTVHLNRPSHKLYNAGYTYSSSNLKTALRQYLQDDDLRHHPLVSPLLSENLSHMPETMVILAECDIVRDEGYAYGKALAKAGNLVACHEFEGMVHAFMSMWGKVPQAQKAIELLCQTVQQDCEKFDAITFT